MSSTVLNDISDFKNLIKAGATIVCERMGIRKSVQPQQEPFWKRRLDDWFQGKWKKDKKRKKEELKKKYRMKVKGFNVVTKELKQRISAKSEKLRRYGARGKQHRHNKLFRCKPKSIVSRVRLKRKL